MLIGILHLHSAIRYIIVLLLIGSLVAAFRGLANRSAYTGGIRKLHFYTTALLNIQMVVGLVLYAWKGYFHLWGHHLEMKSMAGFFGIGHLTSMIIGIGLVNIGYRKALKATTDRTKYKLIAIFFGLGFFMIFFMIPWPFMYPWAKWF